MSDTHDKKNTNTVESTSLKKTYSAPTVKVLGTVEAVTSGGGGGGEPIGGFS